MSENNNLINFVQMYQDNISWSVATDRVEKWLNIFPVNDRNLIFSELAHVLGNTFLTHEQAVLSVQQWLCKPDLVSGGIINDWEDATFLKIMSPGGSHEAIYSLLDGEAKKMGLAPISESKGLKLFVFVDDLSVHGIRILNDLTPWICSDAPGNFDLLILLQRRLTGREEYISKNITKEANLYKKNVRIHWWCDHDFAPIDCYRPRTLPDVPKLKEYLRENNIATQLQLNYGTGKYFSSIEAKELLENQFLLAGICILEHNHNLKPKKYMRPLGNTIWNGLGLGVPIVTWRNCPNSSPLCLWADGLGPALFPRIPNRR